MKRTVAFAVVLAFVAGCSGAGNRNNGFLPGASNGSSMLSAATMTGDGHHRMAKVAMTMRIPRRHRGEHTGLHPATISPLTQSVSIAVDGGAPTVFNATPASPGCSNVSGNTVCTFALNAPVGSDTFTVSTFNALGGGGTILDHGSAVIPVVIGKANTARVTLGPVVSTNADSGIGSLRYAIANANPGDSIIFMLPPGSTTITVGSPLTLPVSLSITGPGVTTSARPHRDRHGRQSNLTFNGVTISGGLSKQIFVINASIAATIAGVILTDGLATTANRPGGAVYNAGTLTLSNDALTGNDSNVDSPFVKVTNHAERPRHANHRLNIASPNGFRPHCIGTPAFGGAVYNHGSLTVSGSTFDSNVLQNNFACALWSYGGAIYNDQDGTLVSTGNTYSNNSAYRGGAVYNNSTLGQATFTSDTFTANLGCTAATGCVVGGCGVGLGSTCSSYAVGSGAALYDAAGPGVTITSSTFSQNVAGGRVTNSYGYGGAIYLGAGSPTVTGSTFTGNLAGGGTSNCSIGDGGAIYENASNTLELDNDTFTNNSAGGDEYGNGGAVYNGNDPDRGSNDTFVSNTTFGTGGGSGCDPNAEASGGAIYADYGVTLTSSTFNNNSASATFDAYGGAVYEANPSNLTRDTFTSNTATGTGLNSAVTASADGGAIYAGSSATMRLTANTFTGNSASALTAVGTHVAGGAIYTKATLTSNGNTFTSNSASIPAGTGAENASGGALSANGSLASSGDVFSTNTASGKNDVYGGALSIYGSYTLAGGTFTSNGTTASGGSAYGGAVDIESIGTLSNSTFTSNSAGMTGQTGNGGAIYDPSGSTLNGVTVTGNTATTAGGGLYADQMVDYVNTSTFSGNTVTHSIAQEEGGGGIFAYYGGQITNSTISGNTVAVSGNHAGGGGFYNDDTNTVVTGTTISGNSVTGSGSGSGGGGIFNFDDATFTNDTITGNSSSIDGGGFEEYFNYHVLLTNVTMYQNKATGNGGNLFNDNNTTPYVTFANSIIAGGTAATGPDIDNTGRVNSNGYNLIGAGVDGGGTFTPSAGDQIGTNLAPINPVLLALSNNGGPTFTNADTASSPGVGKIPVVGGSCNNTGVITDQRGFTRGTSFCDMGAYELNGVASAIRTHVRPFHGIEKHQHARYHPYHSVPPQKR
jgi:predicted outer membrane repeat protein